jgi:hypothetical protein
MFSAEDNYKPIAWSLRALIWGIVLIAGGLLYFQNYPFEFDSEAQLGDGEQIRRTSTNDVLLVLDYQAIQESPSGFSQQDWSAAWIGILEQTVGPVTVATPESLSKRLLDSARVIVLSSSVAGRFPTSLVSLLEESISEGKYLIVERPGKTLRELFSADGEAGVHDPERVTYVEGSETNQEMSVGLDEMPLVTDYIASRQGHPDAEVHLSMDGAPVIYSVEVGRGRVLTIEFDMARQMVALQQGMPREGDYRTDNQRSGESGESETSDLAITGGKRTRYPYADLLKRFVFHHLVQPQTLLPTLWPFPDGTKGALILTHSTGRLGERGLWMEEYERRHFKASADSFVESESLLEAGGSESDSNAGLLWRMDSKKTERLGWAGIKPFRRTVGLELQMRRVERYFERDIDLSRIADGKWTARWAAGFRQLQANGVDLDSSYRPDASGYGFGTGFVFRPLTNEGLPLNVDELPIVFKSGDWSVDLISHFLSRSASYYHEAMTWNIDAQRFASEPSPKRFETWRRLIRQAKQAGHVVTSPTQFHAFQINRWHSRINSELEADAAILMEKTKADAKNRLTIQPSQRIEQVKVPFRLSLAVESQLDNGYVMLPKRFRDATFEFARQEVNRMGGELIGDTLETKSRNWLGKSVKLVPLERGTNRIQVVYR